MKDAISKRLGKVGRILVLIALCLAGFAFGFVARAEARELSPSIVQHQDTAVLTIESVLANGPPLTIDTILDNLPKVEFTPPVVATALTVKQRLALPAPLPSEEWKRRHRQTVIEAARINNVPANLVMAVIAVESGFNPNARNGTSAGLMQIKLATARGYGLSAGNGMQELFRPDINIRVATNYLGAAYKIANGNICKAVSRYNQGLGSAKINADYCAKVARVMRYVEFHIE